MAGTIADVAVDMGELYAVLRRIAQSGDVITYEDLSQAYKVETGVDVHRRQWGAPLGDVSRLCTDAGLPPISTVVVSATDKLPGDGYWGIPGGPPFKDYNAWKEVCDRVYGTEWPETIPAPCLRGGEVWVPETLLTALGRLTVQFARLEGDLKFFVGRLLGRDQELNQIITAELPFRGVVALLTALFRHRIRDEVLTERLEQLLNRANQIEERRNVFVHSQWGMGAADDEGRRFKTTARKAKGLHEQYEELSVAQVEQVSSDAIQLCMDLSTFTVEIYDGHLARMYHANPAAE